MMASVLTKVCTASACGRVGLFGARALAADATNLKKTVLHQFHLDAGAKMVPFAGYDMPIQYKDSIIDSSLHCRKEASLFDVAHMCGMTVKGKDAIAFLHRIVVSDIAALKPGTGGLSVLTNANGGIIDDTVVTKVSEDEIYMVVNAGKKEEEEEEGVKQEEDRIHVW